MVCIVYQGSIFLFKNYSVRLLVPLISKRLDNFVRADAVKANTLFCVRSRTDNFSLLADTFVADTFSTSNQVS